MKTAVMFQSTPSLSLAAVESVFGVSTGYISGIGERLLVRGSESLSTMVHGQTVHHRR